MVEFELKEENTISAVLDAKLARGKPLPQFFMTGDGHRKSSLQWIEVRESLKMYFVFLILENKLCPHVEVFPEDLDEISVSPSLAPLLFQGKPFGWELDIYCDLKPAIELCESLSVSISGRAAPNTLLTDLGILEGKFLILSENLPAYPELTELRVKVSEFRDNYNAYTKRYAERQGNPVPIRLTQTPTTCRVRPFAGI